MTELGPRTSSVQVESGAVRGLIRDGVLSFHGIPYADTRGRRFRAPSMVRPWPGVRDCTLPGPSCPQVATSGTTILEVRLRADTADSRTTMFSEHDCLNLNIFTPGLDAGAHRPVLVWLHPGGYHSGSASADLYDGSNLCRRGDVVVVTIGHRLGVLGYLYLAEVLDSEFAGSGNAGTLDLIRAFEWIGRNIEAFGGDPGCVTAFGQSGGAAKVSTLLATPAAAGLFHRAIIQSGVDDDLRTADVAHQQTKRLLAVLRQRGISQRQVPDVPVEELLSAAVAATATTVVGADYSPVLDRVVLPQYPGRAVAAGSSASVPLLIGTVRHETSALLPGDWAALSRYLGPPGRDLVRCYQDLLQGPEQHALYVALTTDLIRIPVTRYATAKATGGCAPVYLYEVGFEHPLDGGQHGAVHGVDVPLVFDNTDRSKSMRFEQGARKHAAEMADRWITFARTGAPAPPSTWQPIDVRRPTFVFERQSGQRADAYSDRDPLWQELALAGMGLVSRIPR